MRQRITNVDQASSEVARRKCSTVSSCNARKTFWLQYIRARGIIGDNARAAHRCPLNLTRQPNADTRPNNVSGLVAVAHTRRIPLDALLETQPGLVVVDEPIRNRPAIALRRPARQARRLVERRRPKRGVEVRLHDGLLFRGSVPALVREEEARAEDDAIRAHREQARDLGARGDATRGDYEGLSLSRLEVTQYRGEEHEEWRGL